MARRNAPGWQERCSASRRARASASRASAAKVRWVRGAGLVVALADRRAVALAGEQLEGRLPVVGPQPQLLVQRVELGQRRRALEAVVADQPAHDRPVLLLDVR